VSDELERAWAAGFFDGEGTSYLCAGRLRVACFQSTVTGVPDVLLRFRSAVDGHGVVRGPYQPPGNRRPQWQWYAYGADAEAAIALLWSFLTSVKRDQFLRTRAAIA
jgi:hypothetical protein